ncbi:ferredoxin [Microlunatus soli]|uniref:Ferredoxin n=1 Tax=Microlunatus soli TaxID=630515 RepID=A0A1H1R2B1_9ACTN|nr:ferredoxin [Microlunatus soli]SDS29924.1 ferredoxin [Microlunatus soli]
MDDGSEVRVIADREVCIGSGMCTFAVPEVFEQSEQDGTVVLLQEQPAEGLIADVEDAVRSCPSQALRIESAER